MEQWIFDECKLEELYVDVSNWIFPACPHCGHRYFSLSEEEEEEIRFLCDECENAFSMEELELSPSEAAALILQNAQDLLLEEEFTQSRKLAEKAEKMLRQKLKEEETLTVFEPLADVIYLKALLSEYLNDTEMLAKSLMEHVALRKRILELNPSPKNRFLLAVALFDKEHILGSFLKEKVQSEKSLALLEQLLQEVKDNPLEKKNFLLFSMRMMFELFHQALWLEKKAHYAQAMQMWETLVSMSENLQDYDPESRQRAQTLRLQALLKLSELYKLFMDSKEEYRTLSKVIELEKTIFQEKMEDLSDLAEYLDEDWHVDYMEELHQIANKQIRICQILRQEGKEKEAKKAVEQLEALYQLPAALRLKELGDDPAGFAFEQSWLDQTLGQLYQDLDLEPLAEQYYLKSLQDLEPLVKHPEDFEELHEIDYVYEEVLKHFQKNRQWDTVLEILLARRKVLDQMARMRARNEKERLEHKRTREWMEFLNAVEIGETQLRLNQPKEALNSFKLAKLMYQSNKEDIEYQQSAAARRQIDAICSMIERDQKTAQAMLTSSKNR